MKGVGGDDRGTMLDDSVYAPHVTPHREYAHQYDEKRAIANARGENDCPWCKRPWTTDAEHADCDWIYGDTIRATAAELTDAEMTAREAEERRREIGDEWAEDTARDRARGEEE